MKNSAYAILTFCLISQSHAQDSVCYGANCGQEYLDIQESIINFYEFKSSFAIQQAAGNIYTQDDLPACLQNCKKEDKKRRDACTETWGISVFSNESGNLEWDLNALSTCLDRAQEKLEECISPTYNNCMP